MGYYIDPRNCSKEAFLAEKGTKINGDFAKKVFDGGTHLPVCLVDNGFFTAAGICFDEGELAAFSYPGDERPKTWFSVKREDLVEFYPAAVSSARMKSEETQVS